MAVNVHVSSILFEYTDGASELSATGSTIYEVLEDIERRLPGFLFRIVDEQDQLRPHIKIYVGNKMPSKLNARVEDGAQMHILQALSGG